MFGIATQLGLSWCRQPHFQFSMTRHATAQHMPSACAAHARSKLKQQ
jgi:hypothetical protein